MRQLVLNYAITKQISYLKIWLILLFGIENLRKTRRNRIMINGRGALTNDQYEYLKGI